MRKTVDPSFFIRYSFDKAVNDNINQTPRNKVWCNRMCRPQQVNKSPNAAGYQFWPVSPWLILSLLPLMPTDCFLNRGFTLWFNWGVLAFFFTRSEKLCQVLAIQGASVCLGWYASVAMELVWQGTFFHLLYENSPQMLRDEIMENGIVLYTSKALVMRTVVHFFDLVAHPLLAWWCWRKMRSSQFNAPSIIVSYAISRSWSLLHSYYNQGHLRLHYVGHDIYNVHDLRLWYPAYIAEYLWHGYLLYEVCMRRSQSCKKKAIDRLDSKPPLLTQSESGLSVESM